MPFACTECDHPIALVRVSYRVGNTQFVGVPIRVCTNPKCVEKRGGTTYPVKVLSKPRAY